MAIVIQSGRGGKYKVILRDRTLSIYSCVSLMKAELQTFSIILLHKYFYKFQIWKKGWHTGSVKADCIISICHYQYKTTSKVGYL